MFGKLAEMMKQAQAMQRLMKDEHVRALMQHPKAHALLTDAEFLALVKSQDLPKIAAHPKFSALMRDPEFVALLAKINPQTFLTDAA